MERFLDFIKRKNIMLSESAKFYEAYDAEDTNKVIDLIDKILRKHVSANIMKIDKPDESKIGDDKCLTYTWGAWSGSAKSIKNFTMLLLNYKLSETKGDVYSVSFMNGQDWWDAQSGIRKGKAPLTIYTMGTSIIYLLPVIYKVLNNGDFKLDQKDVKKYSSQIFKESIEYDWYFNALTYHVYENLSAKNILQSFRLLNEVAYDDNVKRYKTDLKNKKEKSFSTWKADPKNKEKRSEFFKLDAEYKELLNAIRGGATTIGDLKVALNRNIDVEFTPDESIKAAEETVKERKSVKQQFKEMAVYVNTVIQGIQPGVILCGAPGIGKTFRVKRHLEAAGKIEGKNLCTFKGKASGRALYAALYSFSRKGDIILVDDADSLVGKKAPEDCINLLKAALDSTESDKGRLITYAVAGKLYDEDGDEIPKRCYFNGGLIVITNYRIEDLDKAFRGRVFTQTLDFSTEQLIEIIKELIPTLGKNVLNMESKMKAYNYIMRLNEEGGQKIEISIRSFSTCARIFQNQVTMGDLTDEDCESMISEQLRNQALG